MVVQLGVLNEKLHTLRNDMRMQEQAKATGQPLPRPLVGTAPFLAELIANFDEVLDTQRRVFEYIEASKVQPSDIKTTREEVNATMRSLIIVHAKMVLLNQAPPPATAASASAWLAQIMREYTITSAELDLNDAEFAKFMQPPMRKPQHT